MPFATAQRPPLRPLPVIALGGGAAGPDYFGQAARAYQFARKWLPWVKQAYYTARPYFSKKTYPALPPQSMPFLKRTRGGYRRRRYGRKRGRPRQPVKNRGRQGIARYRVSAQGLRKSLETRKFEYYDNHDTAITVSTTAVISHISGITQALTNNGRTGNQIVCKGVAIKMCIGPSSTMVVPQTVRIMLFRDLTDAGTATPCDETNIQARYGTIAATRTDITFRDDFSAYSRRFKLIKSMKFKVPVFDANPSDAWIERGQHRKIHWYIPMNKLIEYSGGETTNELGGLYLYVDGDTALDSVKHPQLYFRSRVYFTDM